MSFKAVKPGVDFVEQEKELLIFWERAGIVKKYLKKNKTSGKYFSFLDGPITANNPMGVHHGWGRTYKDLWQRYKNLRGYKQRFQNGFDCQGLWVEVEVEKELGLKSKQEIENLVSGNKKASIAKFVELCKARVRKYAAVQTEQSKRLGYFMDWEHSYYTMSDENNYMIWQFLKKCHEEGLIYKGRDSVPWCPRCGTAISQHEMLTEDYKEAVHEAIYLELPIVGREGEFLLVWTTTPWTIPANIAVAVDGKLDYVLVSGKTGDKFWVGKERKEAVFGKEEGKVIKEVKGKELVGLFYRGPFDGLPAVAKVAGKNKGKWHQVVATDGQIMPIAQGEGTGLVHTATGAGTEDFRLGKKYDLPILPVIEENGDYMAGFGFLTGKNAKDDPRLILDYLLAREREGEDWVFKIEKYKHRYPACWRCKTELVWRVVDEWYISMDGRGQKQRRGSPRERMKQVTRKIRWIPEFGLDRELDWLVNMHDWLISKKRYWGLALPIWECGKCGEFEVIGSKEELAKRATSGWVKFKGHSPHRPWVDEVKIKCKCGEKMERVPDVGNPWLDAGIVGFSTITENNQGEPLYTKNKRQWGKWFPADFITESFPGQFKNWFYSLIAQSTILEELPPFKTVLGFATLLGEDGRPMHKSWGNAIDFGEGADRMGVDVMRWLYVRQNPAQNLLFGYKAAGEVRRQFLLPWWNIYNFLVTYAQADGWEPKRGKGQRVGGGVLDRWILARFKETVRAVEVVMDDYNAFGAAQALEELVNDLSLWYVRRSRERVGPTAPDGDDKEDCYATLWGVLGDLCVVLSPFVPFISEAMYRNLTGEESVHLAEWPKVTEVGDEEGRLMETMKVARKVVERGHAARKLSGIPVRQPLAAINVKGGERVSEEVARLIMEELNVERVDWRTEGGEVEVELETKMTPRLREKGKTRELVRAIQEARKEARVNLVDKVEVVAPWLPVDEELLAWVKQRTLAGKMRKGETLVVKKMRG